MRKRGFEVVEKYQDKGINLPKRSTYGSAGYDIEAAEKVVLKSYWKEVFKYLGQKVRGWFSDEEQSDEGLLKPTLVPTGLKAYMHDDEYLKIVNRSSNPLKRNLMLPNSIGIIDQDYYNNPDNEGHIYVQLINYGLHDVTIEKGERIAQGIFTKFLKTDDDQGGLEERTGGFGSSGR